MTNPTNQTSNFTESQKNVIRAYINLKSRAQRLRAHVFLCVGILAGVALVMRMISDVPAQHSDIWKYFYCIAAASLLTSAIGVSLSFYMTHVGKKALLTHGIDPDLVRLIVNLHDGNIGDYEKRKA